MAGNGERLELSYHAEVQEGHHPSQPAHKAPTEAGLTASAACSLVDHAALGLPGMRLSTLNIVEGLKSCCVAAECVNSGIKCGTAVWWKHCIDSSCGVSCHVTYLDVLLMFH